MPTPLLILRSWISERAQDKVLKLSMKDMGGRTAHDEKRFIFVAGLHSVCEPRCGNRADCCYSQ